MTEHAVMGGAELQWAAATDVGRVRKLNEDALLAVPPMFAVADGMGGHDAGEVASALTVERLRQLVEPGEVSVDAISSELQTINAMLRAQGTGDARSSMGTTGVGLALVDNGGVCSWLIFNIGDSRAYCMADGSLVQVSRDHSYVQDLVEAGEIEPYEARTHPHRNVVTKALGVDDDLRPDYWVRPVRAGERFLLCSDGLTSELGDDIIADVLDAGFPADETVGCLVEMAVEAGGRDNVTAVVIDVTAIATADENTTKDGDRFAALRAAEARMIDVAPAWGPGVDIADPTPASGIVVPISEVPTGDSSDETEVESGARPVIAAMPATLGDRPAKKASGGGMVRRPRPVSPPPDGRAHG